jgi:predicted Na+-dependent transporter
MGSSAMATLVGLLDEVASTILLFGLVFGMSATVDVYELYHQIQNWKALCTGAAMQFVILPFIGFCVISAGNFSAPIGITLLVITSSPGGSYSNWWCSLFNAELALSVSMTAVSTLLSLLLLPFNLVLYTHFLYADGSAVQSLDWNALIVSLLTVGTAISAGLFASHRATVKEQRLWEEPALPAEATTGAVTQPSTASEAIAPADEAVGRSVTPIGPERDDEDPTGPPAAVPPHDAVVIKLSSEERLAASSLESFHRTANFFGNMCGLCLILLSIAVSSSSGSSTATSHTIWNQSAGFYFGLAIPPCIGILITIYITTSRFVNLHKPEVVAVAIESCYQNTGIATSVALAMFGGGSDASDALNLGNSTSFTNLTVVDDNENALATAISVPLYYGLVEAVVLGLFCITAWQMGWTKAPRTDNICRVLTHTYEVSTASERRSYGTMHLIETTQSSREAALATSRPTKQPALVPGGLSRLPRPSNCMAGLSINDGSRHHYRRRRPDALSTEFNSDDPADETVAVDASSSSCNGDIQLRENLPGTGSGNDEDQQQHLHGQRRRLRPYAQISSIPSPPSNPLTPVHSQGAAPTRPGESSAVPTADLHADGMSENDAAHLAAIQTRLLGRTVSTMRARITGYRQATRATEAEIPTVSSPHESRPAVGIEDDELI